MKQFAGKENFDQIMVDFVKRVNAFWNWEQEPRAEIEIRPARSKRSLAQNALFWVWMEELSAYFTRHGPGLSKSEAHDLMCHTFLGYETRTIGKTEITKLRTTSGLKVDKMSEFMDKVDAWAADKGCYLPTPADSEYEAYRRRHG